ncbi:MAG: hypothetical protein L0I62_01970 [Gammaproteobacteria bacterium]|nr:hypothetical protein [Gammaproteobacteria bacterium]
MEVTDSGKSIETLQARLEKAQKAGTNARAKAKRKGVWKEKFEGELKYVQYLDTRLDWEKIEAAAGITFDRSNRVAITSEAKDYVFRKTYSPNGQRSPEEKRRRKKIAKLLRELDAEINRGGLARVATSGIDRALRIYFERKHSERREEGAMMTLCRLIKQSGSEHLLEYECYADCLREKFETVKKYKNVDNERTGALNMCSDVGWLQMRADFLDTLAELPAIVEADDAQKGRPKKIHFQGFVLFLREVWRGAGGQGRGCYFDKGSKDRPGEYRGALLAFAQELFRQIGLDPETGVEPPTGRQVDHVLSDEEKNCRTWYSMVHEQAKIDGKINIS